MCSVWFNSLTRRTLNIFQQFTLQYMDHLLKNRIFKKIYLFSFMDMHFYDKCKKIFPNKLLHESYHCYKSLLFGQVVFLTKNMWTFNF